MSLFDNPWSYYFVQSPAYLGLLIAGIMCVGNYRRNPRGAALLGLAILLTLASAGIWILNNFLDFDWLEAFGFNDRRSQMYGMILVTNLMHAGSWILAALAVFARSRHEAVDLFHAED